MYGVGFEKKMGPKRKTDMKRKGKATKKERKSTLKQRVNNKKERRDNKNSHSQVSSSSYSEV